MAQAERRVENTDPFSKVSTKSPSELLSSLLNHGLQLAPMVVTAVVNRVLELMPAQKRRENAASLMPEIKRTNPELAVKLASRIASDTERHKPAAGHEQAAPSVTERYKPAAGHETLASGTERQDPAAGHERLGSDPKKRINP